MNIKHNNNICTVLPSPLGARRFSRTWRTSLCFSSVLDEDISELLGLLTELLLALLASINTFYSLSCMPLTFWIAFMVASSVSDRGTFISPQSHVNSSSLEFGQQWVMEVRAVDGGAAEPGVGRCSQLASRPAKIGCRFQPMGSFQQHVGLEKFPIRKF